MPSTDAPPDVPGEVNVLLGHHFVNAAPEVIAKPGMDLPFLQAPGAIGALPLREDPSAPLGPETHDLHQGGVADRVERCRDGSSHDPPSPGAPGGGREAGVIFGLPPFHGGATP